MQEPNLRAVNLLGGLRILMSSVSAAVPPRNQPAGPLVSRWRFRCPAIEGLLQVAQLE